MLPHPPGLRLPATMRIKATGEFAALRKQGQRAASGCVLVNWKRLAPHQSSCVGVVTSRKLGSAVARSRARRLLRETFRLHQHRLNAPLAAVLVARPSIVGKSLADVERDFLTVMRRAALLREP